MRNGTVLTGISPNFVTINGVNGWWWPFVYQPADDLDFYPSAYDPLLLVLLYWRVRVFRMTASITYDDGTGHGPVTYPDISQDFNVDALTGVTTELDLPDAPAWAANPIVAIEGTAVSPDPYYGNAGARATFGIGNFLWDSGLLACRPNIQVIISADVAQISSIGSAGSPYTSTLIGNDIPMYEGVGPVGNSITGSLDLVPLFYWPYRDVAGANPIYDASTGDQLIFPLPRRAS